MSKITIIDLTFTPCDGDRRRNPIERSSGRLRDLRALSATTSSPESTQRRRRCRHLLDFLERRDVEVGKNVEEMLLRQGRADRSDRKVTEVFKSDSDSEFLKRAGVTDFDDPRYQQYAKRLARLRSIRKYVYRMDVLERTLSYEEVTEIFVRVNSLGAKLRSPDPLRLRSCGTTICGSIRGLRLISP